MRLGEVCTSLSLAALDIWLSHSSRCWFYRVIVIDDFLLYNSRIERRRAKLLRIARCFLTVQVCFSRRVQKMTSQVREQWLCIIRPQLQTVGSLEHKFVMADAKNLHFQAQYGAVFILEDALSVQTDNASMAVFILRMHYPSGRTWANICSSSGYESQV